MFFQQLRQCPAAFLEESAQVDHEEDLTYSLQLIELRIKTNKHILKDKHSQ